MEKKAIFSGESNELLPGGFYQALESHIHHDVIFRTNERDFYAHKCILAARSSHFQLLFDKEVCRSIKRC